MCRHDRSELGKTKIEQLPIERANRALHEGTFAVNLKKSSCDDHNISMNLGAFHEAFPGITH
jgi:hypothetical protein